MRLIQLLENKDYALSKKLFDTLSRDAQRMINSWEWAQWQSGELTTAFEKNSDIAKEIYTIGQPIRDQIRAREGDTIKLYRGLDENATPDRLRADRALYSWTSSEKIAAHFAGKRANERNVQPITDKEINDALKRYEETGFTTFKGKKYKQNKNSPQYYDIYNRYNNYITDGDNLEREFKSVQEFYADVIKRDSEVPGRIVEKEIPVEDIIWVLMGGNANEYIAKGHPE